METNTKTTPDEKSKVVALSQSKFQIFTVCIQQKACPCHKESQELNWQISSTITGNKTPYKSLKNEQNKCYTDNSSYR
jgi:hypothetical protein